MIHLYPITLTGKKFISKRATDFYNTISRYLVRTLVKCKTMPLVMYFKTFLFCANEHSRNLISKIIISVKGFI